MLKFAITFVVIIAVAVAVVLLLARSKPDTLRVERSIVIEAPAEAIHPLIEDLRRWRDWSPWEDKDPAMKREYGGAARGVGATYAWAGNREVGRGSMRITQVDTPTRVQIALHFLEPFENHNVAEFILEPQNGATRVDWSMQGPAPLVTRVMQVFVDLDRMIGRDFEAGLANLKAQVESVKLGEPTASSTLPTTVPEH